MISADLLKAAKDVSVWSLAIIAVSLAAMPVLNMHVSEARLQWAKIAAGLLFGIFMVVLALSSTLGPRVGWTPLRQLGDWSTHDTA